VSSKILFLSILVLSAGCTPESSSPAADGTGEPVFSPFLYVWAGDLDERPGDSDFLAVLDADPISSSYGEVIATEPVGAVGTNPHHAEPVAPHGALLFANGYRSGRTFLFDLSSPEGPRLDREVGAIPGLSFPHSFLRLDDGTLLATMQYGDGTVAGNPGGLVRFDADDNPMMVSSAADASFDGELIRPYSVEAIPSLDRIVTTSRTMNTDREVAADLVQIWSLSDLSLLKTLRVPRVKSLKEPECTLGQGDLCDASQYPAEAQPFESRAMNDGSVLMNTLMCGIYRISAVDTDEPRIDLVLNYPELFGCSVPAVINDFYILPVMFNETILVLDMSDPTAVKEVSRFDTPGYQPHWAASDPRTSRIVVTSSGNTPTFTVLMLDFDSAEGRLTLDESFGSPDFPRAGVSFYRESWPHGDTGTAKPHAAFFGRK